MSTSPRHSPLHRADQVRVLGGQQARESPALSGAKHFHVDIEQDIPSEFLEGVDTLYHLAAELGVPSRRCSVNIDGTSRLLSAAISAGVRRWVHFSSVGVYGPPTCPVVTEDTVPVPLNEHERTRLAADRLVEVTGKRTTLEFSSLRPSNVIGATMTHRSVLALVNAVRRGRFCYFGPRGSIAKHVHVDDVVRALISCRDAPSGSVFNLSSDCLWEDLIGEIARLLGVQAPCLRLPLRPLQSALRILEVRVPLPVTSSRLTSLTHRSTYSPERVVRKLRFMYSRSMPVGMEDVVAVMR